MALSRAEVHAFTRKLYAFLRDEHTVRLTKHHLFHAQISYPDNEYEAYVTVDYRKDILSSLIHEVLHFYYPQWSEKKVLRMESQMVNAITERQAKNILKALANAV
jgi:hypothetical protein